MADSHLSHLKLVFGKPWNSDDCATVFKYKPGLNLSQAYEKLVLYDFCATGCHSLIQHLLKILYNINLYCSIVICIYLEHAVYNIVIALV